MNSVSTFWHGVKVNRPPEVSPVERHSGLLDVAYRHANLRHEPLTFWHEPLTFDVLDRSTFWTATQGSASLQPCADIIYRLYSHQVHCKWRNLCCTFTPRLLDAYRLRQKRRIPALCVTYSHLSDDKFLCQNVGLGNSTQHGRRSVGDEGDASPHFTASGGEHRKCPHTVSVHTTLPCLINSTDINFRLPSGKSLDKLLGWPQPATVYTYRCWVCLLSGIRSPFLAAVQQCADDTGVVGESYSCLPDPRIDLCDTIERLLVMVKPRYVKWWWWLCYVLGYKYNFILR